MDVAEVPKPGQLLELREASDDELVEVTENIIEVLEHCEFEEEDEDLEESDQDELEVCEDYVHLPEAPWEDQYKAVSQKKVVVLVPYFKKISRRRTALIHTHL